LGDGFKLASNSWLDYRVDCRYDSAVIGHTLRAGNVVSPLFSLGWSIVMVELNEGQSCEIVACGFAGVSRKIGVRLMNWDNSFQCVAVIADGCDSVTVL